MYKRVQFSRICSRLCSGRTLEAKAPSHLFPRGSLSISSRTRLGFPGLRAASPSPVSLRNIGIFPVICDAAGGKAATPLFLVFASKGFLSFYILS